MCQKKYASRKAHFESNLLIMNQKRKKILEKIFKIHNKHTLYIFWFVSFIALLICIFLNIFCVRFLNYIIDFCSFFFSFHHFYLPSSSFVMVCVYSSCSLSLNFHVHFIVFGLEFSSHFTYVFCLFFLPPFSIYHAFSQRSKYTQNIYCVCVRIL